MSHDSPPQEDRSIRPLPKRLAVSGGPHFSFLAGGLLAQRSISGSGHERVLRDASNTPPSPHTSTINISSIPSSSSSPLPDTDTDGELPSSCQPKPLTKPSHPLEQDASSSTQASSALTSTSSPLDTTYIETCQMSSTSARASVDGTTPSSSDIDTPGYSTPEPEEDDCELDLLDADVGEAGPTHEVVTAPIFTRDAFLHGDGLSGVIPQYGVLGSLLSIHNHDSAESYQDKRLYINTNAPFSAVVCGVQGAGKSHTVGVLLESMMVAKDRRLGALDKPLAGLVLHFGESGEGAQPCEAAFQCISRDPNVQPAKVRVYVSPSQLKTMKALYQRHFSDRVDVVPLKIAHDELDSTSILSMMCVSTSGEPPLYVQIILTILRELGENFSYRSFKSRLDIRAQDFNPQQKSGFQQRFSLLESFLVERQSGNRFDAGQITIIDLTDPFIDAASACSLFDIITRLFLRSKVSTGKVLVVDEAHKYLTRDRFSAALTQTLLSIVRQQRHLGIRVIMSTQEPTVIPPKLLDLCSITIMHRFASISWFEHLSQHVSSDFGASAFDTVVKLKTGQALVLAPSGIGLFQTKEGEGQPEVGCFGRRYMVMKTRRRVTADGGASILAKS